MRAALTSIACSSSLGTKRNHAVRGGRPVGSPTKRETVAYSGMSEPIYAADRSVRVGSGVEPCGPCDGLPNIAGTVLVAATAVLRQAILLDATIEFFNFGLPASRWP